MVHCMIHCSIFVFLSKKLTLKQSDVFFTISCSNKEPKRIRTRNIRSYAINYTDLTVYITYFRSDALTLCVLHFILVINIAALHQNLHQPLRSVKAPIFELCIAALALYTAQNHEKSRPVQTPNLTQRVNRGMCKPPCRPMRLSTLTDAGVRWCSCRNQ